MRKLARLYTVTKDLRPRTDQFISSFFLLNLLQQSESESCSSCSNFISENNSLVTALFSITKAADSGLKFFY